MEEAPVSIMMTPVNADADAACGGHAVFQRFNEVVVHALGFPGGLVFQAFLLHVRVVQFRIAG